MTGTTLLSGVVGSTAYGLDHEGSDVDRLGMYAAPTVQLLGLTQPKDSIVSIKPDITLHEVGKWCRLALRGNPTVMELLWLEQYEVATELGEELINIRSAFLSASRVRNAYFGYAVQQFNRLEQRQDGTFGPDLAKRTAKHARHMFRLLAQGYGLWTIGELVVKIPDPQAVHDFGDQVAGGDLDVARRLLAAYEAEFNREATVLPDEPETPTVEEWLLAVRHHFYEAR